MTLGSAGLAFYGLWRMGLINPLVFGRSDNAYIGIFILLLITCIMAAVVTFVGGKLILKPLRNMLTSMKKLASGDFSVRTNLSGFLIPRELRQFSEEFNITAKELGGIEIMRSDFVNSFSHEFKTPIVSMRGFAAILKNNELSDADRDEYLNVIIQESDRLATLATNVLNLTKIENQFVLSDIKPFNLSEQIRRAILLLDAKWSNKNLDMNIQLEEVFYTGNEDMLYQVWVNLLDNSIKFSNDGGELEIRLRETPESVLFTLRDYGCGMNSETKTHAFDKFYQGDHSRTVDGNGLGLSVVKKVLSLHDGSITIESKPGEGASISILLPKK
jgi:signal transduction histidine kinase